MTPLGCQLKILAQLAEHENSKGKHGCILSYPHGSGKTVACCMYINQQLSNHNCTIADTKVASSSESFKLVSEKDSVKEAAKLINGFLQAQVAICSDVSKCRSDWQTTKEQWLTLEPGHSVTYSSPVVAAYSCGTTLLHSVFTKQFFTSLYKRNLDGKHILILCGGSGAEVIALKLALAESGIDQNDVKITCVDINSWDYASKKLWNHDSNTSISEGSFTFLQMDMLDEKNLGKLGNLVQAADVTTLIYGLTELYDSAPDNANGCLEAIFKNLKTEGEFIIVDPWKTCFGKDMWIDRLAQQQANIESIGVFSRQKIKLSIEEEHVRDSLVGEWIQQMKMRLNEDIKLSMHVWGRHFMKTKKRSEAPKTALKNSERKYNLAVVITNTSNGISYVRKMLLQTKAASSPRIVDLGKITAGSSEKEIRSSLFHAYSSLTHGSPLFQVFLVTIKQIPLLEYNKELQLACRQAKCCYIDDFEQFIRLNSPKKTKLVLASLENNIPPQNRRVVLCPSHKKDVIACAEAFCSLQSQPQPLRRQCHPEAMSLKSFNGISIDFCTADQKNDCKGEIEGSTSMFVKFDNRVKSQGKQTIFPKDLEHMEGGFNMDVADVVLHGATLMKFPPSKIDDLLFKALGKVAPTGKLEYCLGFAKECKRKRAKRL
eukprot:CAMPEP_0184010656 /NCGR_PEP_ID=MMETSP0954-20121128/3350_1 /TAXON_ID=627963 /ORGANISM="Aplanochytrium sp, Strain PBS07" /LENGTH=656 /DNA_ID=CAMNT_0026290301 /DNA_START=334 /DNA_END=2301 /DNA_ORIENTATION=-